MNQAIMQLTFDPLIRYAPPRGHQQLLKWIGNKHRFARAIIDNFPETFGVYYEPFLGSGAVLGALSPKQGVGSDTFKPLTEIWIALRQDPKRLKAWYDERYDRMMCGGDRVAGYEEIKAAYNKKPNGADLLFLCRACYGGVVRFRKADGYMSTPCGVHQPISPAAFSKRVDAWSRLVYGCEFCVSDYATIMRQAKKNDLIYCDPPYTHSQAILYGAQEFDLRELFEEIGRCKGRGVFVAVSIDGTKKSGDVKCDLPIPLGLFEREILIDCGRSMLRRFQLGGETLETECVSDRLLLTYK
jgi:DNA adenine methylase